MSAQAGSAGQHFAAQLLDRLVKHGYTHCFFVAGGNIMHLLDAMRGRLVGVPVVHEVAAAIAAEYFNATSPGNSRALTLVTAGPGLTNATTGIAGAWLESRELVVVGGQAKRSDLALFAERQRGMQELDGARIVSSITKASVSITFPLPPDDLDGLIELASVGRPGPVFIEVPIDVQAAPATVSEGNPVRAHRPPGPHPADVHAALDILSRSTRPVLLIGGGVASPIDPNLKDRVVDLGIPVMTTVNGADRWSYDEPLHWGRPGMFGMRSANVLIQQADCVVAVGTRLGMQQTGFAWEQFARHALVVQVDVDSAELVKSHPRVDLAINSDAVAFLEELLSRASVQPAWRDWIEFGEGVTGLLTPMRERVSPREVICPTFFYDALSDLAPSDAIITPSSSGGTFTNFYQAFRNRSKQTLISNKALASMGYGLAGALGAAVANPDRLTILCEGDGGFAQNVQELGTVAELGLNLCIFVLDNSGYGSIRTTQRRYFDGAYVGCDRETGLGLPDLEGIARAYGIPFFWASSTSRLREVIGAAIDLDGPRLVRIVTDRDVDVYPKIGSRMTPTGSMVSNPLHLMDPPLEDQLAREVFKFVQSDYSDGGIL